MAVISLDFQHRRLPEHEPLAATRYRGQGPLPLLRARRDVLPSMVTISVLASRNVATPRKWSNRRKKPTLASGAALYFHEVLGAYPPSSRINAQQIPCRNISKFRAIPCRGQPAHWTKLAETIKSREGSIRQAGTNYRENLRALPSAT